MLYTTLNTTSQSFIIQGLLANLDFITFLVKTAYNLILTITLNLI